MSDQRSGPSNVEGAEGGPPRRRASDEPSGEQSFRRRSDDPAQGQPGAGRRASDRRRADGGEVARSGEARPASPKQSLFRRRVSDPPAELVCQIDFALRRNLSDAEILNLGTYDFMAHIGKRVINPGGLTGRDLVLKHLDIKEGSRVLEIGSGTGHAACDIATRYKCHVTATDISPSMIEEAQETVKARGMTDRVVCKVADVTRLPFDADEFDYVIVQAVLMFVNRNWSAALGEIKRVLKPEGRYAGLEFTWKAEPPDDVRRWTDTVCGCPTMVFLGTPEWRAEVDRAGFEQIYANEEKFNMLSVIGFVRDEGFVNSMRIFGKLLRRRANFVRMMQIWRHFSKNIRFFSYTVLAGSKPRNA